MFTSVRESIQQELEEIKEAGLYKEERIITTPQRAEINTQKGSEVLNFCANNYLGLSAHPDIIDAGISAIKSHGFGLSSVRFICGTQDIHKELERKTAEFLGMEDCILYAAAFDANGNIQNVQRGADLENYKYLFSGSDKISSNQLANLGHNTTLSQDFEGLAPDASSGGGWAWNSNNGGPSNSGISTLDPHSGSQCLHLAGGSLGHYNVLSLATYLNPQSSYGPGLSTNALSIASLATPCGPQRRSLPNH